MVFFSLGFQGKGNKKFDRTIPSKTNIYSNWAMFEESESNSREYKTQWFGKTLKICHYF